MKLVPGNKSHFQRTHAAPIQSVEFLTELYSAASMIMDREECEAMVRELEEAHDGRPIPVRKRTVAA